MKSGFFGISGAMLRGEASPLPCFRSIFIGQNGSILFIFVVTHRSELGAEDPPESGTQVLLRLT